MGSSHVASTNTVLDHHLHLDLHEDFLLLGHDFEEVRHQIHEGKAGADPQNFLREATHDHPQLIASIDKFVQRFALVVFNQFC